MLILEVSRSTIWIVDRDNIAIYIVDRDTWKIPKYRQYRELAIYREPAIYRELTIYRELAIYCDHFR